MFLCYTYLHFYAPQGWEILDCELLEKDWKERIGDWNKQNRGLVVLSSSGPGSGQVMVRKERSVGLFLIFGFATHPLHKHFLSF